MHIYFIRISGVISSSFLKLKRYFPAKTKIYLKLNRRLTLLFDSYLFTPAQLMSAGLVISSDSGTGHTISSRLLREGSNYFYVYNVVNRLVTCIRLEINMKK